jgi:hypothetical protein
MSKTRSLAVEYWKFAQRIFQYFILSVIVVIVFIPIVMLVWRP